VILVLSGVGGDETELTGKWWLSFPDVFNSKSPFLSTEKCMEYEDSTYRFRIQDLNQCALPNPRNRMGGNGGSTWQIKTGTPAKVQDLHPCNLISPP
jgi:hypothetical protein